MSSSVKISQLSEIPSIASQDYLPLVQSSSQTTYRATFTDVNAWMNTFGSASHALNADNSISASYALSSSFSNSGSTVVSASYSLSASYLIFSGSGGMLASASHATFADSASYALNATSASYALSSSTANSASVAVSASYSFSGSFVNSASVANSSSYALTASFLSTGNPAATQMPRVVAGLLIKPNWQPYLGSSNTPILITFDNAVLSNAGGTTLSLTGGSQTNNRNTAGMGGLVGTFTNSHWYDIWVVYDSGAPATSTVIADSGTTPKTTTFAAVTALANYNAAYDYGVLVGSIHDDPSDPVYGHVWREWYEYGTKTVWKYRNDVPLGYGLQGVDNTGTVQGGSYAGYTITHYLNSVPQNIQIKLKVKSNGVGNGYSFGDEIQAGNSLSQQDGNVANLPAFGVASNDTQLKVWRGFSAQSWNLLNVLNGTRFGGNPAQWGLVVIAS